jgi:hypothetical protein
MNVDPQLIPNANDGPDPNLEAKPKPEPKDQADPSRDEPPDCGPETALHW